MDSINNQKIETICPILLKKLEYFQTNGLGFAGRHR